MTDQNHDMRATAREYRIAMIVVIGGFIIVIAIGAWFLFGQPSTPQNAQTSQPSSSVNPDSLTPEQRKQWQIATGQAFCQRGLLNAQALGIVPPYARAAALPKATSVTGRFACLVSTDVE